MSALSSGVGGRVVAACLALAACRGEGPPRDRVARPSSPRRIVSLGPSPTEILAALGAVDRLVGRSRWDGWPDAVRAVPVVGDAIRPSVEQVVAARPDLVVLYRAADNGAAITALQRVGLRVVALRIDTIEQFLAAVDSLGTVIGEERRADSIVRSVEDELRAVRGIPLAGRRPRVFVPVWDDPLMTVGAGSFLSELITIGGGVNVYADEPAPSLTVSLEDVIRRDPDVILTGPTSASRILGDRRWHALRAVRGRRVVAYDTTLVSQPSTRLGAAARSIAVLLRSGPR